MKESNKQRSARITNSQVVYTPLDYVCESESESERGDYKRRKNDGPSGYAIFLAVVLVLLVLLV